MILSAYMQEFFGRKNRYNSFDKKMAEGLFGIDGEIDE